MDQIDFPDKYENLMRIAQQALADHRYTQAKELLLRAYDLEPNFEANSLLVFCLFELDEKQEALSQKQCFMKVNIWQAKNLLDFILIY